MVRRFGSKLHTLRIHHGFTLKEFAVALGYTSHSYMSEIETGLKPPTIDLVVKLSRLFNVSIDQLLKDELELELDPQKPPKSQESV